jgi:clan AA aspartic protease (TIGR02281 family)
MKKITLSSCLTKLTLIIIVVVAFIWLFSVLFPRAYNVLEAKALGLNIDEDSAAVITAKVDSILHTPNKNDSVEWKQVKDFEYAVKLEQDGNCYLVGAKVNGVPMKMTLDTGASIMSISIIEYEFLRKQKLLSDSTVEVSKCTIANGDTTKCFTVKIAEVSIGDTSVKDVECLVMENPDAPLLLGMNVLNGLGGVSINYKRKLLILK